MFLCNFTEYGAENGRSMKECFQLQPFEGKEKIIEYLRKNGKQTTISMKLSTDRITGERIKDEKGIAQYTDGKYTWCSDLAYHVEKYNLRLPKEFEDYVLNRP